MSEFTTGIKFIRCFGLGIISLGAVLFSAAVSANTIYSLPGLRPSDPIEFGPVFLNDVDILYTQKNNGSYVMTATQQSEDFSYVWEGDTYTVEDGSYSLTAKFDAGGNLLSGNAKVWGEINGLTSGAGLLAKMKLSDFAYTQDIIGFNTSSLSCPQIIGCTINESIYLVDFGGGFDPANTNWAASGLAVTTVPVPAAAWLFGSAMLGLFGVARRKKA